MALPAISAAATRSGASGRKKPYVLSTEGIIMLMIAGLIELANVILAILDLVFGVGTALAPFLNAIAMFMIGGWLWKKTGQLPLKKALLPFGLNIVPIVRFFPFWLWSVWSTLDKNGSSAEQPTGFQEQKGPQNTQEQQA